jgi:hypothetical protein
MRRRIIQAERRSALKFEKTLPINNRTLTTLCGAGNIGCPRRFLGGAQWVRLPGFWRSSDANMVRQLTPVQYHKRIPAPVEQ